jgi:hypothetical protein
MRTLTSMICLLFWTSLAVAQTDRGTIDGTIFDRIGHKVAGAAVEAKNSNGGAVFAAQSDGQGVYTLSLPPGTYEVSVSAAGHKSIQQGIVITSARPLHGIDVVLAIP